MDELLRIVKVTIKPLIHTALFLLLINRNQDSDKICGTLEEIQRSIEPVLPGAKINTLKVFTPIESDKNSRSTNPQLKPTVRMPL